MKKENKEKPFLLPPKEGDKLTVVMEMDEVLVYTFYPDE
jgi:RNA polymerase II subunit A small phosphatase-like protein/CTD small phosphatase-like protein 2